MYLNWLDEWCMMFKKYRHKIAVTWYLNVILQYSCTFNLTIDKPIQFENQCRVLMRHFSCQSVNHIHDRSWRDPLPGMDAWREYYVFSLIFYITCKCQNTAINPHYRFSATSFVTNFYHYQGSTLKWKTNFLFANHIWIVFCRWKVILTDEFMNIQKVCYWLDQFHMIFEKFHVPVK